MILGGVAVTNDGAKIDRPGRNREIGIALAIVLVAGLLRFAECGRPSLWNDEVVAMRTARAESVPAVLEALKRDKSAAPLHPLLLHFWIRLFGPSDLSGRTLSALLGTLAVAAGSWAAFEAFGARVARLSGWLLAVCPLAVRYSQETRMYALLLLFTCLAWAFLFSFRRGAPILRQIGFGVCLAGLFYSQPLGLFMIAALGVGYLADRGTSRLSLRSWFLIHVGFALSALPWIARYLDHPPQPKPGIGLASRYLTWPQYLIGGNGLTAWVAYGLIALGIWRLRRERNAGVVVGLIGWFTIPLILLIAYSQLRVSIFGPTRYLLFVGPAFLILLARGLVAIGRRPRRVALVAGTAISAQALWLTTYAPEVKPGWREAAAAIRAVDPAATIVVQGRSPSMYPMTLRYYLGPEADVLTVREWTEQVRNGVRAPSPTNWFIRDLYDENPGRPGSLAEYAIDQSLRFDRIEMSHGRRAMVATRAESIHQ